MTPRPSEHPAATEELVAAIEWYHRQRAGLGRELYGALTAAVDTIMMWPAAAPVLPGWHGLPVVRSKHVEVFPYRIIYIATDADIAMVAYAHMRRRPGYWKQRLTDWP
jgi:hypothetical protein